MLEGKKATQQADAWIRTALAVDAVVGLRR